MSARGEERDEGAREQAERLEDEAQRMEGRSTELERDIGTAKEDWESKKSGSLASGAQDQPDDLDVSEAEPFELSEASGDNGSEQPPEREDDSEDDQDR